MKHNSHLRSCFSQRPKNQNSNPGKKFRITNTALPEEDQAGGIAAKRSAEAVSIAEPEPVAIGPEAKRVAG